jgi:CP family cyanate transporter-like MFS transporter
MTSRRTPLWVGAALLLVALNLRLPIAAVSPVLDELRAGLGLSSTGAGLLTTLPILCFGAAAAGAPWVVRRFGAEGGLLACVGVLIVGSAVRLVPEVVPFFLGTLLLGGAIAVCNVVVPIVIKRDYPRPGTMMGLYTMVLIGGAALAAGLTVPIEHALGSWQHAIGIWGLAAVVAFVLWAPAVWKARSEGAIERPPRVLLRGDRLAWLLTAMFGVQSMLFYVSLAWVPDILDDAGLGETTAGAMLSVEMIVGIPVALLTPIVAARLRDQRPIIALGVLCWLVGWGGLLVAPGGAALVWMVFLGVAQGVSFALVITLIVLRAPDAAHATALSGMVQGFGYVLAAGGPLAAGALHDVTGSWEASIVAMLALSLVLLACGLPASRAGWVRGRPAGDAQWAY